MYRPRRRVFYQALAFVAAAPGIATAAYGTTSAQVHQRTVVIEERTSYAEVPGAAAPTPGDATLAFATSSWQVASKAIVYEPDAYAPYTPAEAETVTVDKYYFQLATPVRRRLIPDQQEIAQVGHTPFALAWARALDTPTRRRFVVAEEGSNFSAPPRPEANDQTAWHRQLDWPTRRRFMLEGARVAAPPLPEANDAIGWHRPLDWVTRLKRVTAEEGSIFASPPRAEANDAIGWHRPLELPVRLKRPWQLDFAYGWFTPVEAEEVTVDKYFRELDRPVRRKIVIEGDYAGAPPLPEANDAIGWHKPLEAPTRAKRLPLGIPGEARAPFPVTPWGWYAEAEKPTRAKKSPAFQLSYTFVAAAPSDATTQNWFLPLDIPTRARKLYEFPATAIPVYFVPPTPGAGFEYNWFQKLDEPVRPKRYLATQQGLTVPPALLTTTLEYAWHQRLTEPTRLKLAVGRYPALAQGNVNPVVPFVGPPLAAPNRVKARFNYEAFAPVSYQVELVTADKWFVELARPRPSYVKRLDYPALAIGNVNPVVPLAWQPLDAPLRISARIEYPAHATTLYPLAEQPGDADLAFVTDTGMVLSRTIIFESECYSPFFPALSELDPACRIYEVLEFSGIVTAEGDEDVVVTGQADLTVDGDEEALTPEPDETIEVEC